MLLVTQQLKKKHANCNNTLICESENKQKCKDYKFYLSCYQLKVGFYNFKMFYVSHLMTTKENPIGNKLMNIKKCKNILIPKDFKT